MAQVLQIADFRKQGGRNVAAPVAIASNGKSKGRGSEREARREAWRQAFALREYASAKRSLGWAARHLAVVGAFDADADYFIASLPSDDEALRLWRDATVALLRTPAFDSNCLTWKRAQKLNLGGVDRCITADEVAEMIAADEAWLAANKPKRKPRADRGRE